MNLIIFLWYHIENNIDFYNSTLMVMIQKLFTISGVVGQERMGTSFPHKKLSGNGVPTREILSDSFIIAIKLAIFHCYRVTTFRAPQTMSKLLDIRIGKVLAH